MAVRAVVGTASAVQVQGETTRVHTVGRGGSLDGIITLRNDQADAEWVRLYLTDHLNDARTGSQFPEAGTLPRSAALWVDLMQTEVLLQPGETRNVFYRVAVPDSPEARGTYWCSVMVEPQAAQEIPISAAEPEERTFVLTLRHVIRYQIAVIINVGTSGDKSLAFAEPTLETAVDGSTSFQIFIENTGERWLNPETWLEVYDDLGQLVGRAQAPRGRILPGAAGLRRFDLTGIDSGEYQALLLVDDGEDAVFGTMFSLHLTSE
ncbi:MAG: hypothetical protein ACOYEN_08280 [Limnochordia bacterium]|jgi:hypothetical protein